MNVDGNIEIDESENKLLLDNFLICVQFAWDRN